jgi:hypothetical protein
MMKVLKGYVCSATQVKWLMAKGYVLEETLGFVTKYLHEFVHVFKKVWDVNERICGEVLEGGFTKVLQDLAHEYVFTNFEIMGPWIQ